MYPTMTTSPLDDQTADRLLSGATAPDDAPPGYGAVLGHLASLGDLDGADPAREAHVVAAMSSAVHPGARSLSTARRRAVAGLAAAFTLSTGLAAAAGALPDPAQKAASSVLGSVGISVPGPDTAADASAEDTEDDEGDTGSEGTDDEGTPTDGRSEGTHGAEVSGVARTTDATGRDKGREVCTVASEGKCQPEPGTRPGHAPETPPSTDRPQPPAPSDGRPDGDPSQTGRDKAVDKSGRSEPAQPGGSGGQPDGGQPGGSGGSGGGGNAGGGGGGAGGGSDRRPG